jgi:L,D-transpeptidase catalytic domain/Putative peptidoglycan binding domain
VLTEERPTTPDYPSEEPPRRWPKRLAVGGAMLLVLGAVAAFLIVAFSLSGASLESDPSALAKVNIDQFGGSVESVVATDAKGTEVPVVLKNDRIVPEAKLHPGEQVTVEVTVKRPSVIGTVAGSTSTEKMTMTAPKAKVEGRWFTVKKGKKPRVKFSVPVTQVTYGQPGELKQRTFDKPHRTISLGDQPSAGSAIVAAAPRSWEHLGKFKTVNWFPASGSPAVIATPAPGTEINSSEKLQIVTSEKVKKAFGGKMPELDPEVPGKWAQVNPHTIVFHPTEYGYAMASDVEVKLPAKVDVVGQGGDSQTSSAITWHVPAGSTLRLQQLLAQGGYMPVKWTGEDVAKTPEGEAAAATDAPKGHFTMRWKSTPAELKELWTPGEEEVITKGALMTFQNEHGLETDGVAGKEVWKALMAAAIAGETKPAKGSEGGYSWVMASEALPESVHVWHNGKFVFEGASNTGIPGAETELGTFPVFEHIEETTMSGENPDGSKYEDPGIMWVSYFNGGDALHAFDRASYGTPQSLGCVEMPLEEAATVYPYTPIGTLVSVVS